MVDHKRHCGAGASTAERIPKISTATSLRFPKRRRRGVSLLLCIFVMALTTTIVVGLYQSLSAQLGAIHNTADYERALYLAGAGVHEALSEIEDDSSWLGTISSTELPAGSGYTYSATSADGGSGTVVVTGTGTSGPFTRNLQVTLALE